MSKVYGHQWAYVNNEVAFAETYANAAHRAALEAGIPAATAERIKNLVLVQAIPQDINVAVGIIRNGRPQIWQSNTDRAWVYQTVRDKYGEMNAARDNGSDVLREDHGPSTSRGDEYNRWS